MKLFECQNCRNPIHFDNGTCLNCGYRLGFLPEQCRMSALEPVGLAFMALADRSRPYVFCVNAEHDVCNWLVPEGGNAFCPACRHNHTVPDISWLDKMDLWRRVEQAKRHVFYSILMWKLPVHDRIEDPQHGLAFDFLADTYTAPNILTGHNNGLITLNIAEADDAEREKRRTSMNEPYRTLVGHFRHELGHYFWDLLVANGGPLDRCRALFGDERADYGAALQRHYQNGPPPGWQNSFISSYATAHPWEDFAETWAHYFHMADALETAASFGIRVRPRVRKAADLEVEVDFDPYRARDAEDLVEAWVPLTVALNSVNRSMGQPDLYPFILSQPAVEKLQFVHELIQGTPAQRAQREAAWKAICDGLPSTSPMR
ncbi:putative zinc-binding peptidase [Aquabacter sp. CN5-332]|uniref:zinc-binding metallopeptidase family protein n=1 Tax=Aquabacter sp. CN5-332 TaxID=3156608 RepID=UPI0032B60914